jgi:hypothetical protein
VAQPPQAFIAGPAELQKRPIFRTPTSSDRKLVYHWNTADGLPLKSGELGSYPDSGNSKGGRPACPSGSRVLLPLVAVRFADNAVLGKIGFDQPTHHRFGGAVSFGDRIEIARALVVDAERGAKERQDGFAGGSRKPADKGCKIDNGHGCSLSGTEERSRLLPSPIQPAAHFYPQWVGIWHARIRARTRRSFSVTLHITKSRVARETALSIFKNSQ